MLLVCYVLLYVVALCVKMRYVILCIKRLLMDHIGKLFMGCVLYADDIVLKSTLLPWTSKTCQNM